MAGRSTTQSVYVVAGAVVHHVTEQGGLTQSVYVVAGVVAHHVTEQGGLRVGLPEKIGFRVFNVYYRPQLIPKFSKLFKQRSCQFSLER